MRNFPSVKLYLVFLIILIGFLLVPISLAQRNSCANGRVEAVSNSSFVYEINIINADTIAGFQIPIGFDFGINGIICDSISFTGTRCENFDFLQSKINNEAKSIYISGISQTSPESNAEFLSPGRGTIAKVYFTVTEFNRNENLTMQKRRYPDPTRLFIFSAWDPRGHAVECSFNLQPIRL